MAGCALNAGVESNETDEAGLMVAGSWVGVGVGVEVVIASIV